MTTSPYPSVTDELIAELELAVAESTEGRPNDTLASLLAHIADLKQQLVAAGITAENCEAFRVGAERYRWLIENADMMHWENLLRFADLDGADSVGQFIDAARQS